MITDINQLDLSKNYTYSDYLTWQFNEVVELIKGKVFKMSPSPNTYHQRVSRKLQRHIDNFLIGKKCELFSAPFDVRFVKNNEITTVTQPDLCVICDPAKIDEKGCIGAPDFIIEIISASTRKRDIQDKFFLYEEFGVKEYWIVFPNEQIIETFVLIDEKYVSQGKFTNDDVVKVNTLPGLEINLEDIFIN